MTVIVTYIPPTPTPTDLTPSPSPTGEGSINPHLHCRRQHGTGETGGRNV
jgi:hypothetical protein